MTRTTARLLTTAGTMTAAGLIVAVTGLPAMAATSTPGTSTAKAAGCPSGPVATVLAGNPGVKAQAAEGFYVFHDASGYEIKVTHPGKTKVVYSGEITASKGFAPLKDVRLEGSDYAAETADHKGIVFRLSNFGGIDGFHAYGDCSAAVKVDLKIDGVEASTSQVFLGKTEAHPTSVPFTIDRSKSVTGTPTTSPVKATPLPSSNA